MRQPLQQVISILSLTLFACCYSAAQVADRIPGQIDGSATAVLRGNVHPRTRTQHDLGQVKSDRELAYMTISLKPSTRQQTELQKLLAEQQDRSSARYHKWITPEGYADRFGSSQSDIRKITGWLRSQGFRILSVARGRNFVNFRGSAGQAERAFHVQIHDYQVDGEIHFANVGEPSIPVSLDGLVGGIRGLNDFPIRAGGIHKVSRGLRSNYTFGPGGPNIITPDDVATIYDLTSLIYGGNAGSGQTVVIVGESDFNLADIQAFRSNFQLSSMSIQSYIVGTDPGFTATEQEADLDLEWAGAVARDATFVYLASTDVFSAASYGIDQSLGSVVSMSFGGCEAHNSPASMSSFQAEVQKANSMGITVVASSGDTGAAGCEINPSLGKVASTPIGVQFPASIPEVTAVGATEFIPNDSGYWGINGLLFNSALSYIPEIGWNDTADPAVPSIASSGGGASSCVTQDASNSCTGGFAKPSWQSGLGVPSDDVRDVPDVAFDGSAAHDGYWLCGPAQPWSCASGFPPSPGSYFTFGGTSVATPIFAGMLAMLNQYAVATGTQSAPGLGNINPDLYRYSQSFPAAFHDVTSGDNVVQCFIDPVICPSGSYGYSAGTGYDQVTGLGSIDGNVFFTNWALALPPPDFTLTSDVSSLTVSRGSSGQVTLTIAPQNGFAQTVSLSCSISGLPSATTCSFNPSTITPGASGTTVMTIQASSSSSMMARPKSPLLYAFLISSLGLLGMVFDWKRFPRNVRSLSLKLVLFMLIIPLFACGGGNSSTPPPPPPPPPVTGSVTVTATGAGSVPIVHTMQITVTIQ